MTDAEFMNMNWCGESEYENKGCTPPTHYFIFPAH